MVLEERHPDPRRYRATWPLSIVTTSVDKSIRIIDYKSGEVSAHISTVRFS